MCGLGALGIYLLKYGFEKVIFNDINPEMIEALKEPTNDIVTGVRGVLERIPPELLGDIMRNGILFTGGGALLKGLDKLVSKHTGIPVRIADDAVSCVAKGTGIALENLSSLVNSHL